MTGNRETATHLLQHYFRLVAQNTGVKWDSDNNAEIESIVEALIAASVQQVTETVLKSAMCPACGVRVAGASGLCAECEREAAQLSHAAQAGTQNKTGAASPFDRGGNASFYSSARSMQQAQRHSASPAAYSVPLPDEYTAQAQRVAWGHVPPVAASLGDCPSCLTVIGVVFWQDGKSLIQECPECGVWLEVYKNDGLHVHAVGLESPSEAESGGTLEDVRGELPVPVSAIAYLMADIAPVDAQDVAKQQEARAAVTAWLESLEAE